MRAIAVLTLLLLTGCAKPLLRPTSVQPPSEASVYCSPLQEPVINSLDDLLRAYADALDSWTDCATRHRALVDFLQ